MPCHGLSNDFGEVTFIRYSLQKLLFSLHSVIICIKCISISKKMCRKWTWKSLFN